jgi:hypothetical protein
MNLLLGYYTSADAQRNDEYAKCLNNNLENLAIHKIHLFVEDSSKPPKEHPKLRVIQAGRRVLFQDFFLYATYACPGEVCVISNSDIYFDATLTLAENIPGKTLYCVSRYDDGYLVGNGNVSQDSWIFKAPLAPFKSDWELGRFGSDNRLVAEAKNVGIKVFNPSKSIRSYHVHAGAHPACEATRVPGANAFISPCTLEEVNKNKFYVSVCAIFKNEARYLKEWIEHHLTQGIEHFYLYNNESTDDFYSILQPYEDRGLITLRAQPGDSSQFAAYNHCLSQNASKWIAFIDIDEFIFCKKNCTVFLTAYEEYSAVGVNWQVYGSNGHIAYSPEPVVARFTKKAPITAGINSHIKSIVQPALCDRFINPHFAQLKEGTTVNEKFSLIEGPFSEPSIEQIQIKHYFCKSFEEGRDKLARGRADNGAKRNWTEWLDIDKGCTITDAPDIIFSAPVPRHRAPIKRLQVWNRKVATIQGRTIHGLTTRGRR